MKPKRFLEQHYTLMNGWVAFGVFEEDSGHLYPASYDSLNEATADVRERHEDSIAEIESGEREQDDEFDPSQYRFVDTKTGDLYEVFFANNLLCLSGVGEIDLNKLDVTAGL